VELRVADDGVGVGTAEGSSGSGLALMREKVELSGGTVTLGRGDWGGAEVRVRLPLWVPR
jgi:signal transduction histidine kinase